MLREVKGKKYDAAFKKATVKISTRARKRYFDCSRRTCNYVSKKYRLLLNNMDLFRV